MSDNKIEEMIVANSEARVQSVWWMAHFSSLAVTVGQSVAEGQYLGRLGATGEGVG